MIERVNGRRSDQMRPVKIVHEAYGYADASILIEVGNTKVLCSVHLQTTVPPFLRGKNTGWLTAEYAMLPSATSVRTSREITLMKRNSRSIEISRLISRALRSVIDCSVLGERTILVDCDVLQADGGTRTASITGSYVALKMAQQRWLEAKIITRPFLIDGLVALSICVVNGEVILDPDFQEDSIADADFNFVITESGNIVEIQGSAEKKLVSWEMFDQMRTLMGRGVRYLFTVISQEVSESISLKEKTVKTPLFSLGNRLNIDS